MVTLTISPRPDPKEVRIMLARPGLPSFQYVRAESAAHVHKQLQHQDVRLMMGGTDLFPQMRDGAARPAIVVDLKDLPGIDQITHDPAGGIVVGAAVTMNQLASHPEVREVYSVLAQAAHSVASYQVRNRATIGGNLCNASPCADTAPAALVLDGIMILSSATGQREVPAARFILGPGQTLMAPGEFLLSIRFPQPPAGNAGCYKKLGRSKLGDLSLVGVAAMVYADPSAGSGFRFRLALGSVAPTPLRVPVAEEILASRTPGEASFDAAATEAMKIACPISDVRAGATYQTLMVRTMTMRALREVWASVA